MNNLDSQLWNAMQSEWLLLIEAADLRIRHCLEQLTESQVWERPFLSGNSIGNHILHLCGNLKQWAVDGVLQRNNHRDRSAEFTACGGLDPRQLCEMLSTTLDEVRGALRSMSANDLLEPRVIQGFHVTVLGALSHTIPHLVGHAHQITLTTRLLLGEAYRFHWSPNSDRSQVPL